MARHPGELRWETRLLTVVTATMVVFGIANAYGALSLQTPGGAAAFALRQMVGALVGLLALSVVASVDYHVWRRAAWPLLIATILLLLIPVLPGLGRWSPSLNGARRWVKFGGFQFQPSELARLAIIIWCAMLAAKKGAQVREFKKGVMPFLVGIGAVSLLIFLEPNLSMATLVALLGMVVLFAAGAKIGHFILLGFGGLFLVYEKIQSAQYRMARLTTFLNPGDGTDAAGMQIHQSLVGIGSGRFFGVGFGEGQQKLFLPYAYSDFLFSTIGEEWGFLGVVLVVVLFGIFLWLGFRIARSAPDPFGQFLAVGITAMVGITAVMHMAVSLALMPTTGLTLPFMSYGRSSLVISLVATGILVNIGRMRGRPSKEPAAS
ncbi:MAG TPA: FtsW/RodA/SpoVE family cell cycle protein [Gemmatimonadales bacterium]|nr:FtsW/RodA/SpoVE family cell cycle protein [Gemmatimonadales bacterium]